MLICMRHREFLTRLNSASDIAFGIRILGMVEQFSFTESDTVERLISKYELLKIPSENMWIFDRFMSLLISKTRPRLEGMQAIL